jgi:hypothetical protein
VEFSKAASTVPDYAKMQGPCFSDGDDDGRMNRGMPFCPLCRASRGAPPCLAWPGLI